MILKNSDKIYCAKCQFTKLIEYFLYIKLICSVYILGNVI